MLRFVRLVAQSMTPRVMTPEKMTAHLRAETERMARIVRLSGAKVE